MDKKALVSLIYKSVNTSIEQGDFSIIGKKDTLVLLTAAGQITGVPVQKKKDVDKSEKVRDEFFTAISDSYTKATKEDAFILLKNAVLKTAAGETEYDYLYVFADDIIAASVANSNK